MDDGRWTMDDGRWTVDGGRWTVDGGRWTVDGGRWTATKKPDNQLIIRLLQFEVGGAGGFRTHVRTKRPSAFYMCIFRLVFRVQVWLRNQHN
jgi:hypothetical protein